MLIIEILNNNNINIVLVLFFVMIKNHKAYNTLVHIRLMYIQIQIIT